MRKENVMLNFMKAIACIGVILIHVPFPGVIGELIKKIFSFSVPFFFMISGFYVYNKDIDVIKRRLLKILKIFIFSFILYLSFFAIIHLQKRDLTYWMLENIFNYKFIAKAVFFCTVDFAIPLWYLIAMIELYLLWILIVKKDKINFFINMIPYLFAIQFIHVIACETIGLSWFFKINLITRALPWFLLGYKLNTIKYITQSKNLFIYVFFALIGIAITIMPTILKLKIDFSCIGYLPISLSLFIISIKYSDVHISKFFEYIGKHLSIYVYIFHLLVSYICKFLINYTKISNIDYIFPFIVIIFTLFTATIYNYLLNKIKNMAN